MPAQRPIIVCTGGIIAGLQGGHIHALMVAGCLVMQHAPGGDWKRVDWDALAAWLDRYGYKVADCETETLPTADAASGNAKVRTHRRWTSESVFFSWMMDIEINQRDNVHIS